MYKYSNILHKYSYYKYGAITTKNHVVKVLTTKNHVVKIQKNNPERVHFDSALSHFIPERGCY